MVDVADEGDPLGVDVEGLARDGERVLAELGLAESELSVVVCDDGFIRPLNREWRGKDTATDVLSFPQEEPLAPGRFAQHPPILGDVVISTETARRQAEELGHPLTVEIRALLVHGILHLVGYDHLEPEDTRRMQAEEVRLLGILGVDRAAALVERAS